MNTGKQRVAMPMRRQRRNRDADSLWNEAEWEQMEQASNKIPTTLEEALAAGHICDLDQEERSSCGGILGEEFVEGSFVLRTEGSNAPDLLLPYRARLEFGRIHLKEDSQQEGESK
jgi:hypothetical protein